MVTSGIRFPRTTRAPSTHPATVRRPVPQLRDNNSTIGLRSRDTFSAFTHNPPPAAAGNNHLPQIPVAQIRLPTTPKGSSHTWS